MLKSLVPFQRAQVGERNSADVAQKPPLVLSVSAMMTLHMFIVCRSLSEILFLAKTALKFEFVFMDASPMSRQFVSRRKFLAAFVARAHRPRRGRLARMFPSHVDLYRRRTQRDAAKRTRRQIPTFHFY